jgi:D-arabinose 1-dehydrogenase-like Zn-dependent alcohol dehydrogenase
MSSLPVPADAVQTRLVNGAGGSGSQAFTGAVVPGVAVVVVDGGRTDDDTTVDDGTVDVATVDDATVEEAAEAAGLDGVLVLLVGWDEHAATIASAASVLHSAR